MQIITGTDIIEINRIKQSIETLGEAFLNRIYTPAEIAYCESKHDVKYQHYAARFAAKEAAFKAVSNLLKDKFELTWKQIEIVNNTEGRPSIHWKETKIIDNIKSMDISISHCKEYAVAFVVGWIE